MPLKIAVTVCDCSHVVHAGGDPHRVTQIIELTDEQVPKILWQHLNAVAIAKAHQEKFGGEGHFYGSVTLSLVK